MKLDKDNDNKLIQEQHEFACWVIEYVIKQIPFLNDDPCIDTILYTIKKKREWILGKINDSELHKALMKSIKITDNYNNLFIIRELAYGAARAAETDSIEASNQAIEQAIRVLGFAGAGYFSNIGAFEQFSPLTEPMRRKAEKIAQKESEILYEKLKNIKDGKN